MKSQGFERGQLFIALQEIVPKLDHMAYKTYMDKRKLAPRDGKRRAGRGVVRRFAPIDKIGYPTGFRCWCGAELMFRHGEKGIMAKRKAFFDEHDNCEPPGGT